MKYKGNIFDNCLFNIDKALKFGFKKEKDKFVFQSNLQNNDFEMIVTISSDIDVKVIEIATNEEYLPIYLPHTEGVFIGKIKNEFENKLCELKEKCFDFNIFKTRYAKEIIIYIQQKYQVEPEYLWDKFPNNAVFREPKSQKWFGAILTVKASKLGYGDDKPIEVINLKLPKNSTIVDNENYFPGYHMNKQSWFTICLNESVSLKEIFKHIDTSYNLLIS